MSDRDLTRWASDRLHDVLGFSESSTAQFIVALARKMAKTGQGAASLLEKLGDVDVPTDNATSRAFAKELMARCDFLLCCLSYVYHCGYRSVHCIALS